MKSSKLAKVIGVSALSFGLTVLPFTSPVSAQEAPEAENNPVTAITEGDFDWGLLGLLGLLGLFGLAGRNQNHRNHEPVRYRDPNATTSYTSYRDQ